MRHGTNPSVMIGVVPGVVLRVRYGLLAAEQLSEVLELGGGETHRVGCLRCLGAGRGGRTRSGAWLAQMDAAEGDSGGSEDKHARRHDGLQSGHV